jgi:hypothetical protein
LKIVIAGVWRSLRRRLTHPAERLICPHQLRPNIVPILKIC